jgi:hypothetical protein
LFYENIMIVNIFMNGIPDLYILITHIDTLCMSFQCQALCCKTFSSHLSCVMKVNCHMFE